MAECIDELGNRLRKTDASYHANSRSTAVKPDVKEQCKAYDTLVEFVRLAGGGRFLHWELLHLPHRKATRKCDGRLKWLLAITSTQYIAQLKQAELVRRIGRGNQAPTILAPLNPRRAGASDMKAKVGRICRFAAPGFALRPRRNTVVVPK